MGKNHLTACNWADLGDRICLSFPCKGGAHQLLSIYRERRIGHTITEAGRVQGGLPSFLFLFPSPCMKRNPAVSQPGLSMQDRANSLFEIILVNSHSQAQSRPVPCLISISARAQVETTR